MTSKEKRWTQLLDWVNSNTGFSGKDVLDVIRAIDDSFKGDCSDYDVTKICLTCVHRVTVGHEPYCDDPNSGWGYHGKTLRCERWKGKEPPCVCSTRIKDCKTCKYLEFTKNTGAPYCTNLGSGWDYGTLSCYLWKERDKSCSTCSFYRKDDMWCTNYNSELRGIDGCSEWRSVNKDSIDLLELNRKVENIGLWNREFQKMIFALVERVRRLEEK